MTEEQWTAAAEIANGWVHQMEKTCPHKKDGIRVGSEVFALAGILMVIANIKAAGKDKEFLVGAVAQLWDEVDEFLYSECLQ